MNKFLPERLIEAQDLKGISNSDLAVEVGVSTGMVSKWRRDISPPKETNIESLSQCLNVPASFFFKSDKKVSLEGKLLYRAEKITRNKKKDDSQQCFLEYYTEAFDSILGEFQLYSPDLPDIDLGDPIKMDRNDVEEAAHKLRDYWELGLSPLKTISNFLFTKGIIVQRVNMDRDGVSFIHAGTPYIFIKDGQTASRDKTTILHELGHIFLHHANPNWDRKELTIKEADHFEKQAYFFFGCFNAPREAYTKDVYSISYQCLSSLKSKWQMSIASQIMYLHGLECISSEDKSKLFRSMNWNQKSRSHEPNEHFIIYEESNFLKDAIESLKESNKTSIIAKVTQDLPDIIKTNFSTFDRDEEIVIDIRKFLNPQ